MGDLVQGDFGHDIGPLPGERITMSSDPIANLWKGLGAVGYGRLRRSVAIGGMVVESVKQVRFELQHSDMPPVEVAVRRNLLIGQIVEQHGLPLGTAEQAMYAKARDVLPNGPRG